MSNTNIPIHRRFFGSQRRLAQRGRRLIWVTLIALFSVFIYLMYWWQFASRFVITNDAYVVGNLIPLKAQTIGTVINIRADNTQYVKQGDVVVQLDGLQAKINLEKAIANLADTVRQVETLFSQADTLRQKIAAQQATLQRQQHDLARYRSVATEGAVSAQQIEDVEFKIQELTADIRQTQAELTGAEALIQATDVSNNPKVLQAAAAVKQAYLDQVRQAIVAPVSGYVAKRSIQTGDQVQPETPLLAIVPLDYLWIEANFLEHELRNVHPSQAVEITVDLYGEQVVYHGQVLGLAAGTGSVFGLLPPNNATGNYIHITERVPVRISLRSDELKAHPLRPGLSVVAKIDTEQTGGSVLEPLTSIPDGAYKTTVYDHQLDGADELISTIIKQHRQRRK